MPKPNPTTKEQYASYATLLSELSREERAGLYAEMADRGTRDLHFFMVVGLGNTVLSPSGGIHGRVCSFVGQAEPARKAVFVSRGHLKSTIVTEGTALQAVCRDPREHVLVMSAVAPLAKSFVRSIKRKVQSRKLLRKLYPHMVPDKTQWSDERASILLGGPGTEDVREPSWSAAGLDTGITGGHYTRIIYDDLVTRENVQTPEMQRTVIKAFKELRPVVDEWGTPELLVGTPYRDYDLYGFLRREVPWMFKPLVIPARDREGRPAWPEEFPDERLRELEAFDAEMYWAQYMLNPMPPQLQTFKRGQLRWFRRPGWALDGDWSTEESEPKEVDPSLLTLYLGVDPATGGKDSDETALAVVGTDGFGNFYLLDVVHGVMEQAEMVEAVFQLVDQWGIARTCVEMAGPFAALEGVFSFEQRQRNRWIWIEKAHVGNVHKPTRVKSLLGPVYQNRHMWHAQHLRDGAYEEQLKAFPKGKNDDMCDAVAYAVQVAQKYGHYGAAPQAEVKRQTRSWGGRYGRIAMTLEEIERLTPEMQEEMALAQVASSGIY